MEPDSNFWLADGKTITTGLIGAYIAVELVKLVGGRDIQDGGSLCDTLSRCGGRGPLGLLLQRVLSR